MTTLPPAAGELNRLVTIEQITSTTVDDHGEASHEWAEFASRWVKIEPIKGGENWRAAAVDPNAEYRVTMHYTAGVTSKMRLNLGSERYMYITHVVNPMEQDRATVLMCKEAV